MSQPPADPDAFKRALTITTRAVAGEKDLDIRFGGEIAGLSGGRIVLPNPGTQPSAEAAAAVRGRADALARRSSDRLHRELPTRRRVVIGRRVRRRAAARAEHCSHSLHAGGVTSVHAMVLPLLSSSGGRA